MNIMNSNEAAVRLWCLKRLFDWAGECESKSQGESHKNTSETYFTQKCKESKIGCIKKKLNFSDLTQMYIHLSIFLIKYCFHVTYCNVNYCNINIKIFYE